MAKDTYNYSCCCKRLYQNDSIAPLLELGRTPASMLLPRLMDVGSKVGQVCDGGAGGI